MKRTITDVIDELVNAIDHDETVENSGSCDYGALYGLARHAEAVKGYLECWYPVPGKD